MFHRLLLHLVHGGLAGIGVQGCITADKTLSPTTLLQKTEALLGLPWLKITCTGLGLIELARLTGLNDDGYQRALGLGVAFGGPRVWGCDS